MRSPLLLITGVLALSLLIPASSRADARRFAWTYESATAPRGLAEYEQWVTWKTDKDSDDRYDRLEFRHEFEYGLTDRLQVGLYLADWRYTRTASGSDTQVRSTSIEVVYNLSDPMTSGLGVGLYGEVALGEEKFALEGKLLLEKSFGAWVLAGNTIFEGEWEDRNWVEDKAKLEQTLGLSHEFSPRFMLGLEGLFEKEYVDFSDAGPSLFYAGPSVSVRGSSLWVTSSPLVQLSDEADEPGLLLRTLIGYLF